MWRSARLLAFCVAAPAIGAGCIADEVFIDPFPIPFDRSTGAVVLGGSTSDEGGVLPVVVDTMSPITIFEPAADTADIRLRRLSITLFDRLAGQEPVGRARFPASPTYEVRLCEAAFGTCRVGRDGNNTTVQGIIGGDILGRAAARFDFPQSQMRFFPDIAGSDFDNSLECDAFFQRPFGGGGTFRVNGDDIGYVGVRPAVGACIDVAGAADDVERGLDGMFILSTGVGITVMAASAYDRYVAKLAAPPRAGLPDITVHLAAGPVSAKLGQLGQIALVAEGSGERGPCRELYANRVMSQDLCNLSPQDVPDCPCDNEEETFCRTGSAVVLRTPLDVAIIADQEPFLQGLRDELRPAFPDVDGLLGTDALAKLRVELDYPGNRMFLTCLDQTDCLVRPHVGERNDLDRVTRCLERRTP